MPTRVSKIVPRSKRRLKRQARRLRLAVQAFSVLLTFPVVLLAYSVAYPMGRHAPPPRRAPARTIIVERPQSSLTSTIRE